MKFNVLAIALSLIVLTTGSSRADWQYTKWGESLSSILAKSAQEIEKTTEDEEHDEGKTFGLAQAKTTYKASDTTFKVLFLFENDRLNRVSLKIDNTRTAARILSALGDQYGKPERESTTSTKCPSMERIWRDVNNGNVIEFSGFDCGAGNHNDYRVIYRPILYADETGL